MLVDCSILIENTIKISGLSWIGLRLGFSRAFREQSTMDRDRLRGFVSRPGNAQLADAVSEGIGVNLKDLRRALGATDFPTGLLQHRQNMSPLDLFKRRSTGGWPFLPRHLDCAVHVSRRDREWCRGPNQVGIFRGEEGPAPTLMPTLGDSTTPRSMTFLSSRIFPGQE